MKKLMFFFVVLFVVSCAKPVAENANTSMHIPLTPTQAAEQLSKATIQGTFSTSEIQEMLSFDGAVGLRLYHAVRPTGEETVMAVGVFDKEGDLLDERGGVPYLVSLGNDMGKKATALDRAEAITYLKYGQDSPKKFHVYFSEEALNKVLAMEGVDGIRFYDASHDGNSSMMMVGVKDGGKAGAVDLKGDGEYVLSDRPCPPWCPTNGGKALFSAGGKH